MSLTEPLERWGKVVPTLLFAGGWAFFIPYFVCYLAGVALGVTNGQMRSVFVVGHFGLLALFLGYATFSLRRRFATMSDLLRDPAVWFWCVLIAGFLACGAYLEFPGDPWEHLRRINLPRPEQPLRLRFSWWNNRFAYFWGWTFFSLVDPAHQRLAADLYAAFWQVLLAFQFHRLARSLGFSSAWAKTVVVGILALFGNNVFGFFSYYALAPTMLAHIAYLRGGVGALDLAGRGWSWRTALAMGAALWTMEFNHSQAVMLFLVFCAALAFERAVSRLPPSRASLLPIALLAVSGWGLVFGRVATVALHFPTPQLEPPWVSGWGYYRVWDATLSYYHTLGPQGFVAALAALLLWSRHRVLATLTLAPMAIALFPPFAIALALATATAGSTYRVFFALPSSFMLAAVFREFSRRVPAGRLPERWERLWLAVAVGTFVALGAWARPPIFGKLRLLAERPAPSLALTALDVTAQWFHDNRVIHPGCTITSDAISEFVLASLLGLPENVDRIEGTHKVAAWPSERPVTTRDLLVYRQEIACCGYLALDRHLHEKAMGGAPPARSWSGATSHHWPADAADLAAHAPPGFVEAAGGLVNAGWSKTFVPPFYWFYEPSLPAERMTWPIDSPALRTTPAR